MLLQAVGLHKYYAATPILTDVTMHINEGEKIGLVGVNGAGKSTLLRILAGEESYDSGTIHKQKDLRIGYLAQDGGLDSNRTLHDELLSVFAGLLDMESELRQLESDMATAEGGRLEQVMKRYADLSERFREQRGYETDTRVRGMLSGMGFGSFPPDTRVSSLSGGQKTRLALAKLLLQEPDILMLDEPTNYLDIPTLTWLEDYLRSYRGALLIISHDRYFLDAVVHAIIEIDRTKITRYTGNYTRFVEQKAADYENRLKRYEKQQEEIARLEDFVQRNLARASTSQRAKSRRKVLEKMERMERPAGEVKMSQFAFEIDRVTGHDVLQASGLTYAYNDGEPIFRNVNLQLTRGDSAALVGPNGIGKSTLLKVLVGELPAAEGSVQWGANVKVGYYDQEHESLNPDNTVLEEVWSAYPHLEEVCIRNVLGGFLFSGEAVEKKISSLSGGERARVSLAKLMLKNANVLIFDEPTNHLDLYSKEALEAALIDYEGTLLFVSHDRYFLNKMADRVLEMSRDGIQYFLGNYDDYLEKKNELVELQQLSEATQASSSGKANSSASRQVDIARPQGGPEPSGRSAALSYEEEKRAKREERARQRRLEQLEEEIARFEEQIAAIEKQLLDPENYNDYVKLQQLNEALEQDRKRLEELVEEWGSLIE
jgi:ATP-binding cassette subfamily F protein 3